jgi:hypothetical protein
VLREFKDLLASVDRELDVLLGCGETLALMKLCKSSLESFLREEPDIYSLDDVKGRSVY